MLTREQSLPRELHVMLNDLKQLYTMELVHARCKPLFQHEYALSRLKAEGYRLAVASNSVRNSIEVMMEKSNLRGYLETIVSNQDVKHGKPDPEIYQKAMGLLDVSPDETLVVEDNEHGIASARAAGAHLMIVQEVTDVTYDNIQTHIRRVEAES
jgi:HAD superfamily hydrolase (TIGR01509 family)